MIPPSLPLSLWLLFNLAIVSNWQNYDRSKQRRLLLIFLIGGTLFLPNGRTLFPLPLLPDYDKSAAVNCGLGLILLIYLYRFHNVKPSIKMVDIPVIVFCVVPFFSSMTNSLGLYDAIASSLGNVVAWGIPYITGRIFFGSLSGLDALANGIYLSGLIYVPFCLFEVRMSPQLHRIVYGYHSQMFAMTKRLGGFRPSVFMGHGLELGLWMILASLIGIWLYRHRKIHTIRSIPTIVLVCCLVITAALTRSTGAYFLGMLGIFVLALGTYMKSSLPFIILIVSIFYYLLATIFGAVNLEWLITFISNNFDLDRASSLEFRLHHEETLVQNAWDRFLFGWGGWGRGRPEGAVTDSLWIIIFVRNGFIGLMSLFGIFLLPPLLICTKVFRGKYWNRSFSAPAIVLSMSLTLFALDCLVNAMVNPVYPFVAGALAGVVCQWTK